jgi:hypothetical protein
MSTRKLVALSVGVGLLLTVATMAVEGGAGAVPPGPSDFVTVWGWPLPYFYDNPVGVGAEVVTLQDTFVRLHFVMDWLIFAIIAGVVITAAERKPVDRSTQGSEQ